MAERHTDLTRWLRLSATYDADPRIRRAGNDAELLYLRALAAMKLRDSDGHLAAEWFEMLLRGFRPAAAWRAQEALVREGLWEVCDDGWRIPEGRWARWQDTSEDQAARRETERKRKAAYRARKAGEVEEV